VVLATQVAVEMLHGVKRPIAIFAVRKLFGTVDRVVVAARRLVLVQCNEAVQRDPTRLTGISFASTIFLEVGP